MRQSDREKGLMRCSVTRRRFDKTVKGEMMMRQSDRGEELIRQSEERS